MLDTLFHFFYDFGIMWLAAAPTCPICGGEGIRPKKLSDGKQGWHCRECCHEWISSRLDVISGKANQSDQ